VLLGVVALGVAVVAGGWISPGTASASTTGVTSSQISIGAISSRTGPLAGYFNGLAPGMIAYFKTIDAKGGVDGRKIVLTANLDDGGSSTQFTQDTHTLIDQDHVFAVGVASYWFTPNYFVANRTPTYGYNVSGNWETWPNLFAVGGSTQIYSSADSTYSWFLKKVKANSVAFISYGPSISSSYGACSAFAKSMQATGYHVYADVSAQLGGSYSSDVQRMQQAGTQVVVSCMQASDNLTLSRDLQQYGLKVKQLWLNGYDQTLLNQDSNLMQGVYLDNSANVPFEAANTSKYGNTYSGMQQYISSMNKYEPSFTYNNVSNQGWQSAALIVAGIKAAGPNFTQASVVSATNKMTGFTAAGLASPTNWTVSHTSFTSPACSVWLQVQGKKFVPVFASGKQIFVCVGPNVKKPTVTFPPKGTPGT
jgi:ABC-type branched-subunit amino acid transport system substrate-binding protein